MHSQRFDIVPNEIMHAIPLQEILPKEVVGQIDSIVLPGKLVKRISEVFYAKLATTSPHSVGTHCF